MLAIISKAVMSLGGVGSKLLEFDWGSTTDLLKLILLCCFIFAGFGRLSI